MAEESTLPVPKTVEKATNDTQDSVPIQLVKQESQIGALAPHLSCSNRMKMKQDNAMAEATSNCNESKDKNARSVKLEAVEAQALKDDTPVEPSVSPSLRSSDVSAEPQQQAPSLQQQQQQQSPPSQQSPLQSEPHPSLITPNTASEPTSAATSTPNTSPSITKDVASSTSNTVALNNAENTAIQSIGTTPTQAGSSMQTANVQPAKASTEISAQNEVGNGSTTRTAITATKTTTAQSEAPTSTQPSQAPPSQATTSTPPVATPPAPTTTIASLTAPAPTPTPTPITTFEEIQKQLKNTLDHVEQRNMVSGFQTLSKATSAVVDHCEQLGLTSDDHPYNAIDREQFWAGLNNCWLYALAQRHEPSSDAERLTDQHLYGLREMVVSCADKLERFGLVDYEMGWWEADILAAIDGILAMNYAAAQAAAQAVVAQAAAALFGEDVNM